MELFKLLGTIFDSIGNTLLGGGKAGKKAIAPVDTLLDIEKHTKRKHTIEGCFPVAFFYFIFTESG